MHTAQTSALNRLLATKDNIHSATLLCTHWQHSPHLGTSGLLGLSLSIDCLLSTPAAQVSLSSGPQPSRSASIRLLLLLLLLPCSSSLLA
jgi:hypothetical protein